MATAQAPPSPKITAAERALLAFAAGMPDGRVSVSLLRRTGEHDRRIGYEAAARMARLRSLGLMDQPARTEWADRDGDGRVVARHARVEASITEAGLALLNGR